MSLEVLDKIANFVADPMGCDAEPTHGAETGAGSDALDLHYPTRGVGHAYDASQSFWDRRKQDYCNMPAALGFVQAGALGGVGGIARSSRGMVKAIPGWLQRWLNRPGAPKSNGIGNGSLNANSITIEEFHAADKATYVLYDGGKLVSSVMIKFKGAVSKAACKERLMKELPDILRSASGNAVGRPMRVIEMP